MILEYAQLLSTAHRVIDGTEYYDKTANGRRIKRWRLDDDRESVLYKATHVNHPSAVWARESHSNYRWLHCLFVELLAEYKYRYGRDHACHKLVVPLFKEPNNIESGYFTQPTPAMPDEYKVSGDSIQSYHNYYRGDKQRMANWKNRPVPEFWNVA
jgi:hypothetical protein